MKLIFFRLSHFPPFLQLPIVWMAILGNTVTDSVLFQSLDMPVNKHVSVVNPSVIFLLDVILSKTASFYYVLSLVDKLENNYDILLI